MTYIRICTAYKTDTHKIHLRSPEKKQNDPDWDDVYEQTVNLPSIKRLRCYGKSITKDCDIRYCSCDSKQNCDYVFYICWEKNVKLWYLIHPESFPIVKRILDPNYKPVEQIVTLVDDYLRYNPLSETILKLLIPSYQTTKVEKKRKRK